MNREIKFRALDKRNKKMLHMNDLYVCLCYDEGSIMDVILFNESHSEIKAEDYILMQYTGLKDKNGKEIYELMELNGKYEVDWLKGKYILREISGGDIIDLNYENQYEITREYTKI